MTDNLKVFAENRTENYVPVYFRMTIRRVAVNLPADSV